MVELARAVEGDYRRLRTENERIAESERQAYARVSEAVTAIDGTGGYPDATFTLRLAFGEVKGYQEDGRNVAPTTDFAGAYQHVLDHAGQQDFDLPESWLKAESKVDRSNPCTSSPAS